MTAIASDVPSCPKCRGVMWDNRVGKRNPRAPDFRCRDRSCDGVIWPPKDGNPAPAAKPALAFDETDAEERAELAKATTPAPNHIGLATAQAVDDYNEILELVLQTTVPRLMKADIGVSPESINATVATILIHKQRSAGR